MSVFSLETSSWCRWFCPLFQPLPNGFPHTPELLTMLSCALSILLVFVIFHIALVWWFSCQYNQGLLWFSNQSLCCLWAHWYPSLLQFPSGSYHAGACFLSFLYPSSLACRAWCSSTFHSWDSILEVCHCDNHWFLLRPVAVWALSFTNDEALAFWEASFSQMLF